MSSPASLHNKSHPWVFEHNQPPLMLSGIAFCNTLHRSSVAAITPCLLRPVATILHRSGILFLFVKLVAYMMA
jgi:hypothetical protein